MNDKLLPCPLCGGVLELTVNPSTFLVVHGYDAGATCENCGIGIDAGFYGGGMAMESIRETAAGILNTRPSPWRDIATAPKAGTDVDLLVFGGRETDCFLG